MRASRVSGLNDAAVGQRARCCPPAEGDPARHSLFWIEANRRKGLREAGMSHLNLLQKAGLVPVS